MNNVEILRKAIKQAEAHGFAGLAKGWDVDIWKHAGLDDHSEPYIKEPAGAGDYRAIPWQVVVYNHQFAKALWGEEGLKDWKFYLQQMVVADNSFKYLGQKI